MRYHSDPMYALSCRVRSLIRASLKARGFGKRVKTESILGCTVQEFKAHIERQFMPGMSWENRADWDIDHIVPMASARDENDALALNRFTNLRPLWSLDNRKKSGTVTHLI